MWELVTQKHIQSKTHASYSHHETEDSRGSKDILGDLAEMFTLGELKIVRGLGETGHDRHTEKSNSAGRSSSGSDSKLQASLKDELTSIERPMADSMSLSALPHLTSSSLTDRFRGSIGHYLLVRPYPSLSILFVSPSLRVPEILQTSFMSRIGGLIEWAGSLGIHNASLRRQRRHWCVNGHSRRRRGEARNSQRSIS